MQKIRTYAFEDYDKAVASLIEAFERDPLSHWLFSDKKVRQSNHKTLFGELLKNPKQNKVIDVTDSVDGVAIWFPPYTEQSWTVSPEANSNAATLFSAIGKTCPKQPFWCLEFLGARVTGTGAGSALIRYRLAQLEVGVDVALFTGNEKNIAFYNRFGFAVKSHCQVEGASAWWLVKPGVNERDHPVS